MNITCYIITHKGRPCQRGSYSKLHYSNSPTVFFSKRLAEASLAGRGVDPESGVYVGDGKVKHLAVKEVTLVIPE